MIKENNYSLLLKNMLKVCKDYADAFNKNSEVYFFNVMPTSDKTAKIGLRKINGKIEYFFEGNYFGSYVPPLEPSIENISNQLKKFKATSDEIVNNFKSSIIKPLGEFLAKRELKSLENVLFPKSKLN
ncbi:MAG: hypothetical protein AABX80_02310 [Nanoarchaeota archaeon]